VFKYKDDVIKYIKSTYLGRIIWRYF
jgi:hypothetical protein